MVRKGFRMDTSILLASSEWYSAAKLRCCWDVMVFVPSLSFDPSNSRLLLYSWSFFIALLCLFTATADHFCSYRRSLSIVQETRPERRIGKKRRRNICKVQYRQTDEAGQITILKPYRRTLSFRMISTTRYR
jgi:hypothetical protein